MAPVRPTLPIPTPEELGLVEMNCKLPAGAISLFAAICCYRCEDGEVIPNDGWERTKTRLRERGWRLSTTQDVWLCRRCVRKISNIAADRVYKAEYDQRKRMEAKLPPTVVKTEVRKPGTRLCEKCKHPMRAFSSGKYHCAEHGWIKI